MALWQDQENVYFEADLPGVSASDLDVSLHQGVLKVRGERKPVEGRHYLYNNRPFGRFEQVVTLPEEVQTDGIQAEFVDGVLRVTLPKKPEAKPQRIAVQSN
jgi:HSP20 family protein